MDVLSLLISGDVLELALAQQSDEAASPTSRLAAA